MSSFSFSNKEWRGNRPEFFKIKLCKISRCKREICTFYHPDRRDQHIPPCREFFENGYCRKGDNCINPHTYESVPRFKDSMEQKNEELIKMQKTRIATLEKQLSNTSTVIDDMVEKHKKFMINWDNLRVKHIGAQISLEQAQQEIDEKNRRIEELEAKLKSGTKRKSPVKHVMNLRKR